MRDELASATGLDHAGLNECLEDLHSRGQELESSPAYGVRLVPPVRPDAHLIRRALGTLRVGREVLCFDEVDSTNDVAWDSAQGGGVDGLVILSEQQRCGRGRQGRSWISNPGENILMSVLLRDEDRSLPPDAVTIATGLAVAEAIEQAVGLRAELKWPNDVLLEGAKVAGVLVESRQIDRGAGLVIGVGLNAGSAPPPEQVDFPATSLSEHLADAPERVEIIRALLRRLDAWVQAVAAGQLEGLHEAWMARCCMLNERVTVLCSGHKYIGRVLDVRPLRGLELVDDRGTHVHLPAAGATIVHGGKTGPENK